VSNPILADNNWISILTTAKKKINIVKIRTNYHDLWRETECWSIPKTPLDETIYHLCDTKQFEDENHFLLGCSTPTHISSHVKNLCHTINLLELLSKKNYSVLGMPLSLLFDQINKMLQSLNYSLTFLRFDRPYNHHHHNHQCFMILFN